MAGETFSHSRTIVYYRTIVTDYRFLAKAASLC